MSMSQWTHVNAIFRIDSIGKISDEEIIEVFGKQVNYEDMATFEYEISDTKYLPMGSEGTLEMKVWHNPDNCCIASTTVSVFGDLRDYGDFEEIKTWFDDCCIAFNMRQAVCQVEVEGVGTRVFQHIE